MADLVQQVLAAIDGAEQDADEVHTLRCDRVLGSVSGNVNDPCDCREPDRIRRRCAADRTLLERDGPFCDCGQFGPPTNPYNGQPIPHHYDCSAYQAVQILAEAYGITDERRPQ